MGSTSYIEKYDTSHSSLNPAPPPKPTVLELYSSGDLPVGRTIIHRRFNDAMVAFLECIRQLSRWVEASERGRGIKPPYTIDKDKINGVSIKLGVSQDAEWTSACKYTLTCCKFLLAHASAGAGKVGGRGGGGGS
jgi:beclin 1